MKLSPSGISEPRVAHLPIPFLIPKLNHASLYAVAASAIQIECFSSDGDEDDPRSDVSFRDCPSYPRF